VKDPQQSFEYAEVAVAVPVKGTFSYRVPPDISSQVRVGSEVLVDFNNRRLSGYVLARKSEGTREAKDILEVIGSEPRFHPAEVPFFEWMADYYIHPIGQVLQCALPRGMRRPAYKTACLTEKGASALGRSDLGEGDKEILTWVRDHPERPVAFPFERLRRLQRWGWVAVEDRIGKRCVGPATRKTVCPRAGVDIEAILRRQTGRLKAGNEAEFLREVCDSGTMLLSEVSKRFTNGRYLARKWAQSGVLEIRETPVYTNPAGNIVRPPAEPVKLHRQQQRAVESLCSDLERGGFSCSMLHGVTGSGKTEVYHRLVKAAIESAQQAIVMVPEISLAIYMEGMFRSRFGGKVAVYHSGLSEGERIDQWVRMAKGEVDLVVGARSALFAPLPRLGLIVVDEEHDTAYKQEEGMRYQARDAAVARAKLEGAAVVLGSGTPSVQSYYNSQNGKYRRISMPERVERRPLPEVKIVDMKSDGAGTHPGEALSIELSEAIGRNLEAGNQTLLFLNRRGFHRLYLCRSCGESVRCPNCDVALTYHLREDRLFCHYCGYRSQVPKRCSSCRREALRPYGFGTEKLEQELSERFPEARIARMDTDSVRRKGSAFRILKDFSRHRIDILVGTQMITKGYDFPRVTLVGVIAADLSLGFPDFRAGEQTFQLLTQVAGRSGRGVQEGRVIIQTFNPDHYAIQTAMAYDYEAFFQRETALRRELGYPPYGHLACLRFSGNNRDRTSEYAHRLGRATRQILAEWARKDIQVLGPAEAPLSRLKGKSRWQILIKSASAMVLQYLLTHVDRLARRDLQSTGVRLVIDVDPYQMT